LHIIWVVPGSRYWAIQPSETEVEGEECSWVCLVRLPPSSRRGKLDRRKFLFSCEGLPTYATRIPHVRVRERKAF